MTSLPWSGCTQDRRVTRRRDSWRRGAHTLVVGLGSQVKRPFGSGGSRSLASASWVNSGVRDRKLPAAGVGLLPNNGIERTHESYTQPVSARSPLMPNTFERTGGRIADH